jgi:hypothetical protein
MHRDQVRRLALLVALLLAAYALRVAGLDAQSIWWDEGISLHLATSDVGEIVLDRLNNIHPPLYFIALKGWLALVGVSPFTGRSFSLFASLFQVALVFATVRVMAGRARPAARYRTALVAAVLVALSPLSVIYGQEIRVYAFLPLAYLAMILLAERLLVRREEAPRLFVLLALVEWTALHLHYIAVFGVAFIGLWGLVVYARRGQHRLLWAWVLTHAAVAAASLPWFLAVVGNWPAIQAEANAGTFTAEPVPLPFLFAQVWAFQLTGLAGALGEPIVRWLSGATAVLLVALLVYRAAASDGSRLPRARALALWSVPLVSALVVWAVRSFSHPRYVVMYTIAFFPLVALLLLPARSVASRVLGLLLATCLLLLSAWGLRQYFFDPGAAKPDMRGVAGYLESVATAGDLIIVPDTDWSLPFEYDGPAPITMPGWNTGAPDEPLSGTFECTADACTPSRVFTVEYASGTRDWQGRLPFELERRGVLVGKQPVGDLAVYEYRITAAPEASPACPPSGDEGMPVGARFGPLRLVSAWVEPAAEANSAAAIALCWELVEATAERLSSSLILRDVTGERLGQVDTLLLDTAGRPTDLWPVAAPVRTYHVLPLAAGTPPLEYELAAGVYAVDDGAIRTLEVSEDPAGRQGQTIPIGRLALAAPVAGLANLYAIGEPPLWPQAVDMGQGLSLVGAIFPPGPYRPGQTVRTRLWWRADDPLPDLHPALSMEQAGTALTVNDDGTAQGRYGTDAWVVGELVSEVRDLRVPPDADGATELVVALGGRRAVLGKVDISGESVQMSPPRPQVATDVIFGDVARLIGYDLPQAEFIQGEPVPIVLYWESLDEAGETDYTVFAHLIGPDGRLAGQHDGIPASGSRPTSEWLRGEFITDPHTMIWRSPALVGPATIAVGLYDPATGERLRTRDGAEVFSLPDGLRIQPAE